LDRLSIDSRSLRLRDSLAALGGAATRGSVLVTGSSTGIGRATALRLDQAGFQVFAGVRNRGDAESLEAEGSERLEPVIIDVSEADTIEVTAERIEQVTGGRLDGLVNNAGIVVAGPIETLDLDGLRRQLEVNLTGQVAVTQAFLPQIRAARGRIALIASIGGRMSLPYLSPYHASKFALEAIGDSLRQEMRPFGVDVSIIEPGSIATPFWGKGTDQVGQVLASMSPEQLQLYEAPARAAAEASRKAEARGISPDKVAKAVEHALTSSRPKTRYLVGVDARVQATMRKWLPDRVLDRLVASQL
jgi:NAD(P)-dependent dehydrogenase (short-subunit alcohol dehydrogenase family)